MITLTTAKKLQIVLGGAVSANQLQWEAHYIDTTGDTVGNADGVTNDGTDVDMVAAPAADNRLVYSISVYNADTAEATVTIKTDASGTERIIVSKALSAGQTLQYEDKQGWSVAFASSGGGVSDHGDLTGLDGDDHSQYLLADGTRDGASSQAQDFGTNGVKADAVAESSADNGVSVDGLTIKDSGFALGSDADGDIYYRSSGALARLAKGTADQVLTMNAGATAPEWAAPSGGGSGVVSEAEYEKLQDNIAINAFDIMVNGSLANHEMVDGIADTFTDETGIDTSSSTNESYDAAGDYYGPTGGASWSDTWTESNPNTSGDKAGSSQRSVIPAADISTSGSYVRLTLEAPSGSDLTLDNVSIVERDSGADGVETPTEVLFGGTSGVTISAGETAVSDYLAFAIDASKDYLVIMDVSSTGTQYQTYSNSGLNYYILSGDSYDQASPSVDGNQSQTYSVTKIEVTNSITPNNMTLISNTTTAESEPSEARLIIREEDVDAATVNTDILGYVSRDGGTTWDQVTLADQGDYGSKRILSETKTLTSSGTSMAWKIVTANNKDLKIHDVAILWE
jgi:hypothetical protein